MIAIAVLSLVFLLDEKGELLAAAKKAAEAKSCTFRGETRLVLPEGLDRAGGGDAVRFEGKYDRDAGAWVKTDAFEFVTAGGKTVMRPVSEWKAVKDEGADVQRLLYQGLAGSRPPRPPHEDLAAWSRSVSAVKRSDAKESVGDKPARLYQTEFNAEYSRDLVQSLFPMGKWMERIPIERPVGSARVWIDGDGRILKLELSAKVTASIQGSTVVLIATRTMTITDYDTTKVEIPAEARKVLDSK